MRLGVLGSINRDTITSANGQVAEGLGGVLYTACAAAYLATAALRDIWPELDEKDIQICPIARLGKDVRAAVLDLVATTPGLTCEGLVDWPGRAFHSHIEYLADGTKREVLSGDLPALEAEEVATRLGGLDALLVNFITGFELSLDSLARIRRMVAGPILMDVHSLTLGRRGSGERYWCRPPHWRQWLELADVVQMNADEAAVLGALPRPARAAELAVLARQLLALGPGLAAITRGPQSVIAAARRRSGEVEDLVMAPTPRAAPADGSAGDPTGCGDVFLAGLGVATALGLGPRESLQLANRAAARNCDLTGLDQLHCLTAPS